MPKAGYCNECKKNVWIKEDGSGDCGHSADLITGVYEVKSGKPKKKQPILIITIISIVSLCLCCAIGVLTQIPTGTREKEESIKEDTYVKSSTKIKETIKLSIKSPSSNSTVNVSSIEVVGETEPNAELTVQFINQSHEIKADSQGNFKASVDLHEGKNEIKVVARKSGFIPSGTTIYLTYEIEKTWHEVLNISGNSTKTTEIFEIKGEGKITWSFNGGIGSIFGLDLMREGASFPVDMIANIGNESGSDNSFIHSTGRFYLKILSANGNWTVKVDDKY